MFKLNIFVLFCIQVVKNVSTNRAYPPTKMIQLSLAVSKASYLPLQGRRYIKNGAIVENPSTTMPIFLFGFIPIMKYQPMNDKIACSRRKWSAKSYENMETELLLFTDDEQRLAVFGFRGTEATNLADWSSNLNKFPAQVKLDRTTFTIHKGFKERYQYIANWFQNEYNQVPSDYTIILTGHSLGGAEATIAAVYAAAKLKRKPDAVITYGSPLVGDITFRNYYNRVVGCARTLRLTAKGDLITAKPRVFGYVHVCNKKEVDGKTGFNFLTSHDLYHGYTNGVRNTFNSNDISYGCNRGL